MSILHPFRRKDRNKDKDALAFAAWVSNTLPCCACYPLLWSVYLRGEISTDELVDLATRRADIQESPTEAAHIGGNYAAKATNWQVIPLCRVEHHQGGGLMCQERLKGRFGAHHGLDVPRIIEKLNAEFKAQRMAA